MDEFITFPDRQRPTILVGDCLSELKGLADDSVDCCVTSPPFYNLRDYQTGTWVGGDPQCHHHTVSANTCSQCQAKRIDRQIGIEETPDEYISHLVSIFDDVRRILKPTGTLWLNLGDSYSYDDKWGGQSGGKHAKALHGDAGIGRRRVHTGLKSKDLIGIPWEVAFALRNAGWYLRSDLIWHKPNQFPESVRDRCTKAHEYVFMLSKSKHYYFDSVAIAEPAIGGNAILDATVANTRNRRSVWSINTKPFHGAHFATMPSELAALCIEAGTSEYGCCDQCGAPWTRITERYDQGYDGSRYGERAIKAIGKDYNSSQAKKSTLGSSHGQRTGKKIVLGWRPACTCPDSSPVPCTVLDPFGGAGTTGLVAQRLGRRSTLIELNPDYAIIARDRIDQD